MGRRTVAVGSGDSVGERDREGGSDGESSERCAQPHDEKDMETL